VEKVGLMGDEGKIKFDMNKGLSNMSSNTIYVNMYNHNLKIGVFIYYVHRNIYLL